MSSSKNNINFSRYSKLSSDEFSSLPEEEKGFVRGCILFTEEATALPEGTKMLSRLFCNLRRGEEHCGGPIEVARDKQTQQIRWKCMECGEKGSITNFEGTEWDLSHLSPLQASRYLYEKYDVWQQMSDSEREVINQMLDWYGDLSEEDFKRMEAIYKSEKNTIANEEIGQEHLPACKLKSLLNCDWEVPGSTIHLRDDLPLKKLKEITFFANARTYLVQMNMEKGFGLDERGYLKPEHVRLLLDELEWYDEYLDDGEFVEYLYELLDEREMRGLWITRMIMESAGIIHKRNGVYTMVGKKMYLLDEDNAGKLYQQMFSSYCRKVNLNMLDFENDLFLAQKQLPYTLYRLQKMAVFWASGRELMEGSIFDDAASELANSIPSQFVTLSVRFYQIVLAPLIRFGLLEARTSDRVLSPEYDPPDEFKKTALYDQFINFNVNN